LRKHGTPGPGPVQHRPNQSTPRPAAARDVRLRNWHSVRDWLAGPLKDAAKEP